MLPGVPFCILANGFLKCIQNPTIPELLTGPLQRNWATQLLVLSATQTWKLFLTKTPRLDEAFGLERFSASTPEKLSNLGAFKVPEMIRCLGRKLTHKEGFHRFACTESVITPLRLGKYMDFLRSKSKSYVNRCCRQAPGHDSWLELHSIPSLTPIHIQFIRKPWLRWCTMKLNCNHSASQWRCELRDTLPTHFCGASYCFQVWDF